MAGQPLQTLAYPPAAHPAPLSDPALPPRPPWPLPLPQDEVVCEDSEHAEEEETQETLARAALMRNLQK